MEKKIYRLTKILDPLIQKNPNIYWKIFAKCLLHYEKILHKRGLPLQKYHSLIKQYVQLIANQISKPYKFFSHHRAIRHPIDHYELGKQLFYPLIDFSHSVVKGKEYLHIMEEILRAKENVIIFANHQTEADGFILHLLLDKEFSYLSKHITFIAGDRVLTDALAVPISLGLNLFSVYSKKYFHIYPQQKSKMIAHNKRTIFCISRHLKKGQQCIVIFPSGGRDRYNSQNRTLEIAPFDAKSIDLLYLLGKKSKLKTHFFPLALFTHNLLPPPESLQVQIGESRYVNESPVFLHFGERICMENFSLEKDNDNHAGGENDDRSRYIWHCVQQLYKQIALF